MGTYGTTLTLDRTTLDGGQDDPDQQLRFRDRVAFFRSLAQSLSAETIRLHKGAIRIETALIL